MVKIKANHKVTQREILKYHICEHHKVGYEALEKLCEKQQKTLIKRDQVIERLSKNIEYNQNQLTEWRTNQKNWVSKISQELIDKANNHNQAMEEQKTHYEKELKELGDLYDKAVEHNKEMVKVNQDCLETNRDILRDHNEITRAYNGLHHMGKFAEELGIDINHMKFPSDTMQTPSYPSGHSIQGILIGSALKMKYGKSAFMQTAKNISYSRRVARAHYKSDSKMGEELGNSMYKHIKNKI